jgi:hypothetical protein
VVLSGALSACVMRPRASRSGAMRPLAGAVRTRGIDIHFALRLREEAFAWGKQEGGTEARACLRSCSRAA